MADPVLLWSGFVGWDNPVTGPTFTITSASVTPGTGCHLVLMISTVSAGTTQFAATAPTGGSLTWSPQKVVSAASPYSPCSGIWTAPCNNAGSFTVAATLAGGTGSDFDIYFATLWKADADPVTPFGGKEATQGGAGNGAVSITLDAAPTTSDWVIAQCLVDENTNSQFSAFAASPGTWTLKTAGNDLNGDGTTTDVSGHQLAFNAGFRKSSTATAVDWSDVNSGGDNFGSTQAALVVKSAAANQTWTGSSGTMLMTGSTSAFGGSGTATWVQGTTATMLMTGTSGSFIVGLSWASTSATMLMTGTSGAFSASGAGTWSSGTATMLMSGSTGTFSGGSTLRYPVSVSGRKLLDQTGEVYLINTMSAWGMPQNLSNAEITTALAGLAAQNFNAVTIAFCGNYYGSPWLRYQNKAGANFFTGTPLQSSLGSAWSSVDWIMSEATRLNMTVLMSLYTGGTNGGGGQRAGCATEMIAAGTTNSYNFGFAVATRYAAYPNIVWHMGSDGLWIYPADFTTMADAFFHGIKDAEGSTHRLILCEPNEGGTGKAMFKDLEGTSPAGYQWLHLDILDHYRYTSNSVESIEGNYSDASPYPIWDCEPPYKGASFYTGDYPQQLRERNYAIHFEGGCGINYGDEAFWPFSYGGTFVGGGTPWVPVLTSTETTQAGYCWAFVQANCRETSFAPSNWVTTGMGSGDTKAAAGNGNSTALAYFPNSRTIVVDTTVIAGTGNVRLRWFDPTNNTYTNISLSEAQNASRSVTHPGSNSVGLQDWVLVVNTSGDQTWGGSNATMLVTGQSGSFTPGSQTWAGSAGVMVMTSIGGALTPTGSAFWFGAGGTMLMAGQSGLFVPSSSPQTWPSAGATMLIAGTSSGAVVQNIPVRAGSTLVTKMYVGTSQIFKIYLGSTQL